MSAISEDRLFPIQNHGYDYFTGVCDDGRQVVMGLLCPHVVAYFFDADGNLLGDEHRLWNKPAPRFGTDGPYTTYDDDFVAALSSQMLAWQATLGFRSRTIYLRAFLDKRHPVGIELLLEYLRNLETADWFDEEEERQVYIETRGEWLAEGMFVWWWAKDYHVERTARWNLRRVPASGNLLPHLVVIPFEFRIAYNSGNDWLVSFPIR